MALKKQKPDRGQYLALIDRDTQVAEPLECFPRQNFVFDELFLKKIFHRAQSIGYMREPIKGGGQKLHVTVFRRFMERLFDCIDETPNIKVEEFGQKNMNPWLDWKDIRLVLEKDAADGSERLPQVRLNFAERCNFVFEGQGNSVSGMIVGVIIFAAIFVNVIVIFGLLTEEKGTWCAYLFTVEYLCKLAVAPFCRYSVFHEDWLLEKTVPDPKDADAALPAGMTSLARLAAFVFTPMNLIDFFSILPTWIEVVLKLVATSSDGSTGINLQFLRALRLFRLFRVLKFGKFSSTLSVLGVTIGNSVQAIGVLCLYIAMISMLAGAVIQQFEYPPTNIDDPKLEMELNHSFKDVPMAMKWVAGRMVTMQHSLPEKKALPQSLVSAFIVIFLGLFKGVIFVLPIATITEAYKRADTNLKAQQRLQAEVEEDKTAPLGTEWCKDPSAPAARVEMWTTDKHMVGVGSFNLPFYEKSQRVKFWVPLIGELKSLCGTHPGVEIEVDWQAAPDSKPKDKLPKGDLTVTVFQGAGFKTSAGDARRCVLEVPVKLYPDNAEQNNHLMSHEFSAEANCAPSAPQWNQSKTFTISWEEKGSRRQSDEEWQRQVLDLLRQQGEKLDALESKVAK
jgi:hypothetical protein